MSMIMMVDSEILFTKNTLASPDSSNGYLVVHCSGDLYQHRAAISDAVAVARIMNATLVLPKLDVNASWPHDGGFHGIYDVEHFIDTLRSVVRIVPRIPKTEKIKAYQMHPPRDAPVSWYTTVALEKMREHGAIYFTPFSNNLVVNYRNPELYLLRCRVESDALSFKPDILISATNAYNKLRQKGDFVILDLLHVDTEKHRIIECVTFSMYRGRTVEVCPFPKAVGHHLHEMGYNNSTTIYLTGSKAFNGERFRETLGTMFPHIENYSTLAPEASAGPAIDYFFCGHGDHLTTLSPLHGESSYYPRTLLKSCPPRSYMRRPGGRMSKEELRGLVSGRNSGLAYRLKEDNRCMNNGSISIEHH